MRNCPVCHYEYNADECPECGWPNNTGNEITNTTGLSRELLKLADDNKKLHAALQAAQERNAQQAAQLEQARSLIVPAVNITNYPYKQEAREWLSANAPQPALQERGE